MEAVMKATIYGGLCFVTFSITCLAYLPIQDAIAGPESPAIRPIHNQTVEPHQTKGRIFFAWPWVRKTEEAVALAVVGMEGCDPCKRMKKEVIPVLLDEGYRVGYTNYKEWEGPKIKVAPTLFYLSATGKVLRREEGFQDVAHIKRYLTKP
jgi:hypothetical protein